MANGRGHNLENSPICMNFHYLVITWSLPGKLAHLYDFSIRSFDCMVCRSFHTLSQYDFHSNIIRPSQSHMSKLMGKNTRGPEGPEAVT